MYKKFALARAIIRAKCPWFLPAVMLLRVVECVDVATMGVSKTAVLYANPTFTETLTPAQCAAYLCHEAMHCMRNHHSRFVATGAPEALGELWNIAADCEINDDLKAAGFEVDPRWYYPRTVEMKDGLPAESYFAVLRARPVAERPKSGSGAGQGNCGSGAGNPGAYERKEASQEGASSGGSGGAGSPDATPAEIAAAQSAFAAALSAEVSRGRGTVPGGLSRWADDYTKPAKVRWQDRLRRIVGHAVEARPGATDRAYDRCSRRQAGLGFGVGKPVLARSVEYAPRIAVAVDTSGSMSRDDLSRALSEVNSILRSGMSLELTSCDSAMSQVATLKSAADLKTKGARVFRGGGGTDFNPVVEHFAKRPTSKRPDVLIYLTDGDGGSPSTAPQGMKVIWAVIANENSFARVAPHLSRSGSVLRVDL